MIELPRDPRATDGLQSSLEGARVELRAIFRSYGLQGRKRAAGEFCVSMDERLGVVFVEGGERFHRATVCRTEDRSRGLLPMQRAAIKRVDRLPDPTEMLAQVADLQLAECRETVVIFAAETRLTVADEEEGTHAAILIEPSLYAA